MITTSAAAETDVRKIDLVLSQLSSLPTLAPIAVRLMTLTASGESHVKEISRLIESDAALSAQVLSRARRADLATASDVPSIERAVILLGLKTIRHIVLTTKVMEVLSAARGSPQFDRRAFWKHCLAVACAARRIAMSMKQGCDPDDAFLAGLLHDLGKIALDACLPKSYERVVQEAERRRTDLLAVERSVLGVDHTVAGRRVAERWQLPEPLVSAIWLHHLPPEALPAATRREGLVPVIWAADLLARSHRLGHSANYANGLTFEDAAASLGLDAGACRSVIEALPTEIEERADWVGLDDLRSGALYVDALMQSTQDLARLNEEVRIQNEQLKRVEGYFRSLCELSPGGPGAQTGELCASAAQAIGGALRVDTVLVFMRDMTGEHVIVGQHAQGTPPTCDVLEAKLFPSAEEEFAAVQMSRAGTWITPAPAGATPAIDLHRANLGKLPVWMLPVTRDGKWVAGAMFAAPTEHVIRLRGEAEEIGGLSAAIGLTLEHALTHARIVRLSEDFAATHHRLATVQHELAARKTSRMTAELAAGAAHELNTPLAVISGRAQLLRERAPGEKEREMAQEIVVNAQRVSDMISDLMDYAEPGAPRPASIDVTAHVNAALADVLKSEKQTRRIDVQTTADLPHVRCDPDQLNAALTELVRNAVEATGPDGRITVKGFHERTDDTVVLEMADDGCGMTPEVAARAFDPFFSHRSAGRGRGMGLPRARRLIQTNGGAMTLESAPGAGTTVRVTLPRAHD